MRSGKLHLTFIRRAKEERASPAVLRDQVFPSDAIDDTFTPRPRGPVVADETSIYESDTEMRSDSEFVPADLGRLVVGNKGRLLDSRRTPVTVVDVAPARGEFVVRVEAFEDAGATWSLFLSELGRFQFERDSVEAGRDQVEELRQSLARFDRARSYECDARGFAAASALDWASARST